jgi:hypothetical protein
MDTWDKYYSYIKKMDPMDTRDNYYSYKKMDPMDTLDKYY